MKKISGACTSSRNVFAVGGLARLPGDQVAELVDVVGGAGREQRHAERVRPLLLVVLAAEHRGVGERVAEHHPLGEVALRVASLVRNVGNTGSPARSTLVTPAALQLGDHEPRVFLRGREVERVRDGHRRLHAVRRRAGPRSARRSGGTCPRRRRSGRRRTRASSPRASLRPRASALPLGQLRADERGPVLARLLG